MTRLHSIYRIALISLLLTAWVVALLVIMLQWPLSLLQVLAALSAIALALTLVIPSFRGTFVLGNILIIASIIILLGDLFETGLVALTAKRAVLGAALLTGIIIERIVPHRHLASWMLLMIATKIEFIIVSAFIASVPVDTPLFIPLTAWWILIPLMLSGVVFLILQMPAWYRGAVVATTLIAVFLLASVVIDSIFSALSFLLALAATMWPLVTERLIGRKVFHQPTQD